MSARGKQRERRAGSILEAALDAMLLGHDVHFYMETGQNKLTIGAVKTADIGYHKQKIASITWSNRKNRQAQRMEISAEKFKEMLSSRARMKAKVEGIPFK